MNSIGNSYWPFYVENRCDDFVYGRDFHADLWLPRKPTVGDVRRAIAQHMMRPGARMELRRWVGRTKSGEEVFDVWRNDFIFVDLNGKDKDRREVVEKEQKTLHDDDQPFPIVGRHENVIFIRPL